MAQTSRKKILLRIVLGFVALFVLALVLVPVLVPAEKWKQIAFDRLEAQTGLVATAGSASASLIPLGLRLEDLEVRDPENRPEWSGLELDLHEVVVRARLRPLFSGRFEVDQVRLVQPRVVLRPSAAAAPDTTASPAAGGAAEPARNISLALAAVVVEDGTVEIDQPDGSRLELRGLSNTASVTIEGTAGSGAAEGTLDSLVLSPPGAEAVVLRDLGWKLDADFASDGSGGSVRVGELVLRGVRATGEASWEGAATPAVKADLDLGVDLQALSREWFEPRRAELPWPEGIDPSGFGDFDGHFAGHVSFEGTVDPDAAPEELARRVHLTGELEEVTGRLLGRDDLATLRATVEFADARLAVDPLRVSTPAGALEGSYVARPLADTDARLDLAGELDAASARQIAASLWPTLEPLLEEGATGPDQWPSVAGKVAVQLGADLPVDPAAEPRLTWQATTASLKLRPVDVDADFELRDVRLTGDAKNASWESGTVHGPGVELTPRFDVALTPEATRVTGRVDARRLDLDELQKHLAPPPETAMGNWLVGVAYAAGGEEMWVPPAELAADLDLAADEVLASGHRLQSVSGKAKLADRRLAVSDVEASLGSGRVQATADLDYNQDPPHWQTGVQARGVPASVLLAPDVPKLAGALDTDFSGDFEFAGGLTVDPKAAMQMLTGDLSLDAAAGLLRTEPVLGGEISRFVGSYAPKWKQLAFDALDAELTVKDGDVLFDRFLISGDTEVRVDGLVGLDGRCDYRLDVVLPPSATPDVGALQPVVDLLRTDDGHFPFTVKVTGPAARPSVQVDLDALRQRAEEKGRDELEDKVNDTVKGLLDKLKGKN